MRALHVKLLRDMKRSLGMMLAIISIIALGVASLVCMLGAYTNLDQARKAYYAQCRMADFWVELKKAPVEDVMRLGDIPGISSLRHRISFPVMIDFEGEARPVNALALSLPGERKSVINDVVLRSGTWFTPDQRNQVIVSEKFAKARGIAPGAVLDVLVDGQLKPFVVVGTAITAEFVYLTQPGSMMDDPRSYGVLFMKRDYAEEVFDMAGSCNSLAGLLTPAARLDGAGTIYETLERRLEPYGVFGVTPLSLQMSNMTLLAEMGGLQTMASMLPLFFLAVAALIMNVLMTRMAEQQRTIIGTLKALGYSDRELQAHFRWFGLVIGLAGGGSGCALGYWMAGGMVGMYQGVFTFPGLHNRAFPWMMLAGLAIAVVFAVLGSLRGVRRVAQLNPAEAMRAPAPPAGSRIVIERFEGFWRRLDFRWQMLLRTMFRQKGRTLVSVFAALAGSALVLLSLGMLDSMDAMIAYQFDQVMRGDYTLSFNDPVSGDALPELRGLPGVARMEEQFVVDGSFRNGLRKKKTAITGVQADTELTGLYDSNGASVRVPEAGLLLSDHLAAELAVVPGDVLLFAPVRGDQTPRRVVVRGIVKSLLGLQAYADIRWLNELMGESAALTGVQVLGRMNAREEASFFKTVKTWPVLQAISSTREQKAAITKQFNQSMQGMVFIMVGFAAVIFFGSILNGALISLAERTREIATFRVLGYSPGEISALFLRENLLTNVAGALLGLPVGFFLLEGMLAGFVTDAYRFPCEVNMITWFVTMALALIFVLSAQWIVHRQILKIDWQEALSMKE